MGWVNELVKQLENQLASTLARQTGRLGGEDPTNVNPQATQGEQHMRGSTNMVQPHNRLFILT